MVTNSTSKNYQPSEIFGEQIERQHREKVRLLLWDWGQTLELIDRKRREIIAYDLWAKDAAETLGAANLSGMPQGIGTSDNVSRAVIEIERRRKLFEDASASASNDIEKILRRKQLIDEMVEELSAIQQKVIRLRYEGGHKWQFISLKLCYNLVSVKRFERESIDEIAKRIDFER